MALAVKRDPWQMAEAYMKQGQEMHLSPNEAAKRAVECLIADGMATDVLRSIGPWAIEALWRQQQPITVREREPSAASHGIRRVDVAALKKPKSILEALWEVDGTWLPLGDLLRIQCQDLAQRYSRQSLEAAAKSVAFSSLVDRMKSSTRTVSEQLSESDVLAIFNGINP